MPKPRLVLFDLDDTLSDHQLASRTALAETYAQQPILQRRPLAEVEAEWERVLEVVHLEVLAGRVSPDEARRQRYHHLFAWCGQAAPAAHVGAVATAYRTRYQRARQTVPGAVALLEALQGRVQIGIVTNNLVAEQREKLDFLRLTPYIDFMVTSEEAGVSKPDPAIFAQALARAGCVAAEAVMIGDSWGSDVVGAQNAGIRVVWFNRSGADNPDIGRVAEVRSLLPTQTVVDLLLGEGRGA